MNPMQPTRRDRMGLKGGLLGAALVLMAPLAWATPPSFTGNAITVPYPDIGESITVNLRQLNVLTGSAGIDVSSGSGTIYVGGTPESGMYEVEVVTNSGTTPGGMVCVTLTNTDGAGLPTAPVQMDLMLVSEYGSTGTMLVPVQFAAGPTVNLGDPVQQAACDDPNQAPVVQLGGTVVLSDTDGQPGEQISVTAQAVDPENDELTYEWYVDGQTTLLATGPSPLLTLPDGSTVLRVVVTDQGGLSATDTMAVTISPPLNATANAGVDRTVQDSDGLPGEDVLLDGSQSSAGSQTIVTYQWFLMGEGGEEVLDTSSQPTTTVRLPDGVTTVYLRIITTNQQQYQDAVVITVLDVNGGAGAPVANAGGNRTVADSDGDVGEQVTLDASGSTDPDGSLVNYEWFLVSESLEALGTGVNLTVFLPDGANVVRLRVTDDLGNQTEVDVTITVQAPGTGGGLAGLSNLSPNQQRAAAAVDRICGRLFDLQGNGQPLSGDQQDLLARCDGLLNNSTPEDQRAALDDLVPRDLAVARTQTLLSATTQFSGVSDRLAALRGGASGVSLAGLSISVDGKMVPLAHLQAMVKDLLGGGASADEPGGLLGDKWGLWARGNYSFGDKKPTDNAPSFKADGWGVIGGVDYRLTNSSVLGVSLGYGDNSVKFNSRRDGGLDTESWAASVYGSWYATNNFYLDGIVNASRIDYGARRSITLVNNTGTFSSQALGKTDGVTLSGGISSGYDLVFGGLTLSPNLGVFYIDSTIDAFTETGAGGLNLRYDKQTFKSLTSTVGLRVSYALNMPWGVLMPHLRIDSVHEFENDVEVMGVRLAADPDAAGAPPILVETDSPDQSYWRLATGLSAQFIHGISGYVEYQRLASFRYIDFHDVSVGLRFQRSF